MRVYSRMDCSDSSIVWDPYSSPSRFPHQTFGPVPRYTFEYRTQRRIPSKFIILYADLWWYRSLTNSCFHRLLLKRWCNANPPRWSVVHGRPVFPTRFILCLKLRVRSSILEDADIDISPWSLCKVWAFDWSGAPKLSFHRLSDDACRAVGAGHEPLDCVCIAWSNRRAICQAWRCDKWFSHRVQK